MTKFIHCVCEQRKKFLRAKGLVIGTWYCPYHRWVTLRLVPGPEFVPGVSTDAIPNVTKVTE